MPNLPWSCKTLQHMHRLRCGVMAAINGAESWIGIQAFLKHEILQQHTLINDAKYAHTRTNHWLACHAAHDFSTLGNKTSSQLPSIAYITVSGLTCISSQRQSISAINGFQVSAHLNCLSCATQPSTSCTMYTISHQHLNGIIPCKDSISHK